MVFSGTKRGEICSFFGWPDLFSKKKWLGKNPAIRFFPRRLGCLWPASTLYFVVCFALPIHPLGLIVVVVKDCCGKAIIVVDCFRGGQAGVWCNEAGGRVRKSNEFECMASGPSSRADRGDDCRTTNIFLSKNCCQRGLCDYSAGTILPQLQQRQNCGIILDMSLGAYFWSRSQRAIATELQKQVRQKNLMVDHSRGTSAMILQKGSRHCSRSLDALGGTFSFLFSPFWTLL